MPVFVLNIESMDPFHPKIVLFLLNGPSQFTNSCLIPNSKVSKAKPTLLFGETQFISVDTPWSGIIISSKPEKGSANLSNFLQHTLREDVNLSPIHMKTHKNRIDQLNPCSVGEISRTPDSNSSCHFFHLHPTLCS